MGRPLRLEFSGVLYHVTSRGDRQENIYESDDDRVKFLDIFGEVCKSYRMKEIGEYFGLSYSMVSRILKDSRFKT